MKTQRRLNEVVAQYVHLIYLNLVLLDQWPIVGQKIATDVARTEQRPILPNHQFQHIQVMVVVQLIRSVFLYNQLLLAEFPNAHKESNAIKYFIISP